MYKPIEYITNMPEALKKTALTGLTGLVIALGASGCESAATRGMTFTLGKVEYGAKTTRSKDPEIQRQVINSDAKFEDNVSTVPGSFGVKYKGE